MQSDKLQNKFVPSGLSKEGNKDCCHLKCPSAFCLSKIVGFPEICNHFMFLAGKAFYVSSNWKATCFLADTDKMLKTHWNIVDTQH